MLQSLAEQSGQSLINGDFIIILFKASNVTHTVFINFGFTVLAYILLCPTNLGACT